MASLLALALIVPLAASGLADPTGSQPDRMARLQAVVAARDAEPLTGLRVMTPMQREIKAVLDSSRVRLEDLELEAGGEDSADLIRLQRETRLKVLAIQERYAQSEGRLDLARRLRASMMKVQRGATIIR